VSFTGKLYGFQEDAFKKMLDIEHVLVAYEMGLGKTVITIAVIERLLDEGKVALGLVIVPSSLKYQWKRMIDQYTDDATVLVIDGDPATRHGQYSEALTGDYDYIILNYEQIVNDWVFVSKLAYDYVVVDECTAIKGFRAKRSRKIKKLGGKYRFGLSGQPLENKPEEVYSIMEWIEPGVLGRFDTFDRTFIVRNAWGKPVRYKNLPTLHSRLSRSMVRKRRDDPDVRGQLPQVVEQVMDIPFDVAGAKLYRLVIKELQYEMATFQAEYGGGGFDLLRHYGMAGPGDSDEMVARGRIMSKLTALRMLCDNPGLLIDSARKASSAYAVELNDRGLLQGQTKAPKMDEAVALVDEILDQDHRHKVCLFSFFKGNLARLQQVYGARSVLFTGDMDAKQKDAAKTRFQTQRDVRVFLSSDAGGYGVDLPEANYLINYDLPWSAGKLDQRNARIVRLSSTWESVTLINLLMQGSVEERMYALLTQKRAIASAVVDGRGIDRKGNLSLDLKSLTEFLESSTV
jgi:SNF2 family DNA or RNA helicase